MIIQVMKSGFGALTQKQEPRRNVILNLTNCRGEIDTIQQVAKSKEYKEAKEPTEGNLFWFGLALRDSDIELLKAKPCVINRYPLMDVSIIEFL